MLLTRQRVPPRTLSSLVLRVGGAAVFLLGLTIFLIGSYNEYTRFQDYQFHLELDQIAKDMHKRAKRPYSPPSYTLAQSAPLWQVAWR
jgi:hypothetical protein